jgi:sugar phosphate permease
VSVRSDPYRRRWLVWAILAAGFLLVNVYRLSTGVLTDDLARLYDATATEIGTLHAAFFYIYAPLQIAAGVLADRAGIRRSATVGVGLMSLSGFAFGLAPTYLVAFGARVGIGLGASVVFITTLRFCANWFRPNEFATVSGLTVAVAGLGGVLATTPLALAVGTVGLRATLVGLSTVGLVIAATIALLARDSPADAGLPAIEGVPASRSLTLGEVLRSVRTVLEERET